MSASPGAHAAPVTIASSATVPKHDAHRSKPCGDGWPADQLGDDRELAAGDLDARRLGADLQPLGDARQRARIGLLDREVVEDRDAARRPRRRRR